MQNSHSTSAFPEHQYEPSYTQTPSNVQAQREESLDIEAGLDFVDEFLSSADLERDLREMSGAKGKASGILKA
jgi:hypothetical protein